LKSFTGLPFRENSQMHFGDSTTPRLKKHFEPRPHVTIDRRCLGIPVFCDPAIHVHQAFPEIDPASLYCEQFAGTHAEVVRDDEDGLDLISERVDDETVFVRFQEPFANVVFRERFDHRKPKN
jgi:hypothetical protein